MDFTFTEEHKMLQKECRKFCEKEIAPYVEELDRRERTPYESIRKLAKQGYLSVTMPEEYGGAGADMLSAAIISIEMSRVCPSTALSAGASTLLFGGSVYHVGNEEQKKKYLKPIVKGEKIGCWGMTEPGAGSDVISLKSTAKKDGDYYILNGQKTFITNAPYADFFVVYAVTDKSLGHRGVSAFILERGMEGLSTGEPFDKMGMRGSPTGEIFMEDLKIHKSQLLGTENRGFYDALLSMNDERALAPTLAIGIMETCLETSVKYAKERVQFGQSIAFFQAIQFKLARMYVAIENSRTTLYQLLWMIEQGIDWIKAHKSEFAMKASAAKLYSSEMATQCALDAIQIHGGYGYMKEYHMERFMRDAKLMEIGAGTSEIQQLIIARELIK